MGKILANMDLIFKPTERSDWGDEVLTLRLSPSKLLKGLGEGLNSPHLDEWKITKAWSWVVMQTQDIESDRVYNLYDWKTNDAYADPEDFWSQTEVELYLRGPIKAELLALKDLLSVYFS